MYKILSRLVTCAVCSLMLCMSSFAATTASNFNGFDYKADASWSGTTDNDCVGYNLFVSGAKYRQQESGDHTSINVATATYFDYNSCTNVSTYWSGFINNGVTFSSNAGLSMASLTASITVEGTSYDFSTDTESAINGTVSIDINWTGQGAVAKTSFNDRYFESNSLLISKTSGLSRAGIATGYVTLESGPNLAPGGADQALLGFGSGTVLNISH